MSSLNTANELAMATQGALGPRAETSPGQKGLKEEIQSLTDAQHHETISLTQLDHALGGMIDTARADLSQASQALAQAPEALAQFKAAVTTGLGPQHAASQTPLPENTDSHIETATDTTGPRPMFGHN